MSGHKSGVAERVREVSSNWVWFHCSIHKEAPAAKNMPNELSDVLQTVVQIVSLIKHRPLNSRLFTSLCDEMGSNISFCIRKSGGCQVARYCVGFCIAEGMPFVPSINYM